MKGSPFPSVDIWTATEVLVVLPIPSCPCVLSPHVQTFPFTSTAAPPWSPPAIILKVRLEGVTLTKRGVIFVFYNCYKLVIPGIKSPGVPFSPTPKVAKFEPRPYLRKQMINKIPLPHIFGCTSVDFHPEKTLDIHQFLLTKLCDFGYQQLETKRKR